MKKVSYWLGLGLSFKFHNVSVKLNTTVYANVVLNKKNICKKQADPLFHVDKSIKIRKK